MNNLFIDRDWFKVWSKSHYPKLMRDGISTMVSMYSPYFLDDSESDKNGPYTAALTLGLFKDSSGKTNIIFLSMFPRSLLNPSQLVIHSRNLCKDYFDNSSKVSVQGVEYEWASPDFFLVPCEEGSRNSIFKEIASKNGGVTIKRFHYERYGKTLENLLKRALPKIIEGRVWVVSKPGRKLELRSMDDKFLMVLSGYPSTESTATVWALCQAILYLEAGGLFNEDYLDDYKIKPMHKLYGQ